MKKPTAVCVNEMTNYHMTLWDEAHPESNAIQWLQERLTYVHAIATSLWEDVDNQKLRDTAIEFAETQAKRRQESLEPSQPKAI